VRLTARRLVDAVQPKPFGIPTTREPVPASISVALASAQGGTATAAQLVASLARSAEQATLLGPRTLLPVGVDWQPARVGGADMHERVSKLDTPPGGVAVGWSKPPLSLPVFEALLIGPSMVLTATVVTQVGPPDSGLAAGILALVVLSELLAFELYDRTSFSISFAPILAAGLIGGPTATLIATWSVAFVRGALRRSRWDKILFNGSAFSLFGLCATWLATAGGGLPMRAGELTALVAATLGASAVYYLHTFLIAAVVALDLHADPRVVWVRNFRWLFPHYLVLGAMGLGLAVATVELGPLGSALFLAPPLMMRFVLKQYTDRTAGAV